MVSSQQDSAYALMANAYNRRFVNPQQEVAEFDALVEVQSDKA